MTRSFLRPRLLLVLSTLLATAVGGLAGPAPLRPMPESAEGPIPVTLSETGVFESTATLTPAEPLVPYDLNVPFWSDGAAKKRWAVFPRRGPKPVPAHFAATGEWSFPPGTLFVKHFELPVDEAHPDVVRRLETRLLVVNATGGVYGVTYKWRPDNRDADLLPTNLLEAISIRTTTGVRTQNWYYPSRFDCQTCHTVLNGGVLGPKTRQLNRDFTYPDGQTENQLTRWLRLGLLDACDANPNALRRLKRTDDLAVSLVDRARSWLDANCAHCHRPGGTVANFDARYDTPLAEQNLIDGPILINEGIDHARVIAPRDPWRSILFLRASTLEPLKMPPLAHELVDRDGMECLRAWIESLPGPPVLAPPQIRPSGGEFPGPIDVRLTSADPGATIRFTVDGTEPGKAAKLYDRPIHLAEPVTLRARAFRPGYTRSITVQETFMVGSP